MRQEDEILLARDLAINGKLDQSRLVLNEILSRDPHNPTTLYVLGYVETNARNYGLALNHFMKSLELDPERWQIYNNLAEVLHRLHRNEESIAFAIQSIEMTKGKVSGCFANLAAAYCWNAQPDEAIAACDMGLEVKPESIPLKDNKAIALLMKREWEQGWDLYDSALGVQWRTEIVYGDEPRWDGQPMDGLVVYGEQGLGDEILFASCMPDVLRDCTSVTMDIMPQLESLFRRSFPGAKVYGSRLDRNATWAEANINARVSLGGLPRFYRRSTEAFPGTPYLVPCPKRSTMWKRLFEEVPGAKVGIAWTGGNLLTGSEQRRIDLEHWGPILQQDAHFVDLEYRDRYEDILRMPYEVAHYPWATLSKDYDDTVALVSALDLVICVCTTIVHVAGGLGVPCWCIVPDKPAWRFGLEHEDFPWHSSVRLIRQNGRPWPAVIEQIAGELHDHLHRYGFETAGRRHGADEQHHPAPERSDPDRATHPRAGSHDQEEGADGVHVPEVPGAAPVGVRRRRAVHGRRHDREGGSERSLQPEGRDASPSCEGAEAL